MAAIKVQCTQFSAHSTHGPRMAWIVWFLVMMTNPAAAQVNPIHAAANAMAGAAANAMAGAAANLVTQRPPFRTASLLNTTRNLQPQNPTTMHMGFYNGHLHYDIAALLANIATTAVAGTVYLIEHGKANVLIRALLFCAAVFFTCALFIIWVFAVFRAWRNMGAKDNTVRTEEEKVRYFIVLVGCGAAAMVAMMFAVLYLP